MRSYTNNRRHTQPRVESLEGKALLSTAAFLHHVAPEVQAARMVAHSTASFGGTLTGPYSDVRVPYFADIQSYVTSGTLTGVGSTHLAGTLFVRPGTRSGRLVGQLVMRNAGGSMIVNVAASATAGTYTYKVAITSGSDTAFRGGTGTLMINQTPSFSSPYYSSGQSTMTFN